MSDERISSIGPASPRRAAGLAGALTLLVTPLAFVAWGIVSSELISGATPLVTKVVAPSGVVVLLAVGAGGLTAAVRRRVTAELMERLAGAGGAVCVGATAVCNYWGIDGGSAFWSVFIGVIVGGGLWFVPGALFVTAASRARRAL